MPVGTDHTLLPNSTLNMIQIIHIKILNSFFLYLILALLSSYSYPPNLITFDMKNNFFERFSDRAVCFTGSPSAFIIATLMVIIWAVTGPLFNFSETW